MQKIVPFLWFHDKAEEAARFYVSIFKNSKILSVARYPEGTPGQAGTVMTVTFKIMGQEFMALNGGPHYTISPAISFLVKCKTRREIDTLWKRLSEGGQEVQCGWLTDKFGVSWQIVPEILGTMLTDKDPGRPRRVMSAVLKMKKLEIEPIKKAFRL